MAENAAHLSSSSSLANPSIFEVIAQESLMSSLQSSAKIICQVIYNKDPAHFEWLVKWFDEIYFCSNCLLQYHYLKTCNASFSESFYNLQRIPILNSSRTSLSKSERLGSLFFVAVLPYVSEKLRQYKEKVQEENLLSSDAKKIFDNVESALKYMSASYETIKLIQFIRYLTGGSATHSPLLNLARVQLTYQTEESKRFPLYSWKEIIFSIFSSSRRIPDFKSVLVKILCQGLEFGAFFIQFVHWWNSEDARSKMKPAPVLKPPHESSKNSLVAKGLCPVCLRKRRVEVVLQTSGYVFCYKCILDVLNKTGQCPVTHIPSTIKDLIRVYDTNT